MTVATVHATTLERALNESDARYSDLIENANDLIVTVDLEVRLTSVNRACELALGYTRAEAIGMPAALFVPEDWHETLGLAFAAKSIQDAPGTVYEIELLAKDGRRIAVEVSSTLIECNGEPVGIQAICRDLRERNAAAQSLHESEGLFRSVFEYAATGMLLVSPTGVVQRANAKLCELFGYTSEELCGFEVVALKHPDDRVAARAQLKRILAREVALDNAAQRYMHRDGTTLWLQAIASEVHDEAGATVCYVTQFQDVTARRAAESALRESEERFRTLFESSPSGMDVVDHDGRIVLTNAALESLLGYTKDELSKLQFPDLTHPDDLEADAEMVEDMIHGRRSSYELEKRYRRKDGTDVWVHLTVCTLADESGGPPSTMGIREDITERKRNETALAGSEARARAMLDTALDAIVSSDANGVVLEFNPAAERMFGRTRADVVGQRINSLLMPPDAGEANYERLLRAGAGEVLAQRVDLTAMRADGSEFPAELSQTLIDVGDGPFFTSFLRDLSERKALEAQLLQSQKLEAVGQLAGGIAHDFNNLLTAITSYADLAAGALDGAGDERLRESVAGIRSAADQAARLTQQLLAFSRRQVLKPEILCVNSIVEEHVPMLRRVLGEEIEVVLALESELGSAEIDPGLLSQVLMNLSVNARDAMPSGGVLTMETANVYLNAAPTMSGPVSGPHVMLAVSDTGTGMAAETLARVFEPFFTTKELGKGTGLGLATVIGIVEQSGGCVSVYSEPEHGTSFKVYLPHVAGVAQAPLPAPPRVDRRACHERILFVEDNELVRGPVSQVLEELGYDVLSAGSPAEALEVAGVHDAIDLLITDIVMPGMNGRRLAELLLERQPQLKVLYISGYTDDAVIARGIVDREMAFLQKPFGSDQLAQKLGELLDG